MQKSTKYLIISAITFAVGYLFLRYAYFTSENNPFANEIVLIILGTIVTIAITAALLNKQSEVEIEKEQRVKIFDIKSSLYFDLINFIEKIILKSEISSNDLVNLEFLTHKISVIASNEVLNEYSNFVKTVKKVALDSNITSLESNELSQQLAKLCEKIRQDLVPQEEKREINIQSVMKKNS